MNSCSSATMSRRAHTFTSPESFGLFMEALRDLQIYADDSEQSMPDATRLEAHLDSALEALIRCHQEFPGDLLPRYYLGITLTMKNQHLYAKSILQQILRATNGQNLPAPAVASQNIVQTLLVPRPWPLLDRAINLFEEVIQYGYAVLEEAARFNLAHIYAKRDGAGDLQKSLDLLKQILTSIQLTRPVAADAHRWNFLERLFEKKRAARERANRESLALAFQTRTLTCAVQARLALENANEAQYRASTQEIEAVREEVDQTQDLDPEAKHDLLADSCTKAGFILFLHATRNENKDTELTAAEASLDQALYYKPFWIPAQTYLAMVYVAQARLDEAKKELVSVVGSTAVSEPAVDQARNIN